MPFFLARLLARFGLLQRWATPVVVIAVVFATSWPLMALAEPGGSKLVEPGNYWWYFVVTASTVGYGDFYPTTAAGHVVGVFVIVGGIVALTTVFTKLASVMDEIRGRYMQGTVATDATGHTVLLGYEPGRTERIVGELLADSKRRVVLGAWDETGSHPMPGQGVDFVRGDLSDEDVLRRAGVDRAEVILVDARDDNEALAVAVTVVHLSAQAHKVVALRDMGRAALIRHVDGDIRCVQWHSPRMIAEELISPGIAEVYTELMTHGGSSTYSVRLPEALGPVLVEQCQTALGRRHGAILLAARSGGRLLVNPDWSTELAPGAVLYYVSPGRLTADQIGAALAATAAGDPSVPPAARDRARA